LYTTVPIAQLMFGTSLPNIYLFIFKNEVRQFQI
jgi:hypothetical protein